MSRLAIEHLAERGDYRGNDGGCKETGLKSQKLAVFRWRTSRRVESRTQNSTHGWVLPPGRTVRAKENNDDSDQPSEHHGTDPVDQTKTNQRRHEPENNAPRQSMFADKTFRRVRQYVSHLILLSTLRSFVPKSVNSSLKFILTTTRVDARRIQALVTQNLSKTDEVVVGLSQVTMSKRVPQLVSRKRHAGDS